MFMFGDIAFVFSITDHERCRMKLGQKEKLTLIFLPQHNAVTTSLVCQKLPDKFELSAGYHRVMFPLRALCFSDVSLSQRIQLHV